MISTVLARRYAKALFAAGKEEDKLQAFNETLQALNEFLKANPDIEAALESPVIGLDVKQEVVEELIKAAKVDKIMANFLRTLVQNNRVHYLGLIADAYQELMDEEMGIVRAKVITAIPLKKDLQKKMQDTFSQLTGKQVVLEAVEDPDIIGGVIAKVGDKVWDGSIKSQLMGFKESIGRGEIG
ncbi:MAG: F0F1 ATP synthase subunit delta [Thermodesulfobacteria bacterium]|nr:F0F1 ATP synthase subunit delta [Thermodesulfobacteriota bacterium]